MASLKFIMDVDDDQPEEPPAQGGDGSISHFRAPSQHTQQTAPDPVYPGRVSHSDQVIRQTTEKSITSSRRGAASSGISTATPALMAASSGSSERRRSSASNDSQEHAGYASAASSSSTGAGLNPPNTPMRPMPGSTSPDMTVKYTPITGRVSRARKGVPVHICEICRPPKTFTRAEHLRRHQLSHQTPGYPCTYPGCDRSFHRPDLLARHQSRHTEPEVDDTSALRGGGEGSRQSSLGSGASNLDPSMQTATLSTVSGDQTVPSARSAPPSDTSSLHNLPPHTHALQPSDSQGSANSPLPPPGPVTTANDRSGFLATRPRDNLYSGAPVFSVVVPPLDIHDLSMSGTSYSTAVNSFQQPPSTPSVFATQGVSLPTLSIPDNNPPELYHPDASPWASSASDSTYSTPVSDNARNSRPWLGQHRSPTGHRASATLLSPYPNPSLRELPRYSVESISAAAPRPIPALPFQPSHFSPAIHDPNYNSLMDVPMTGLEPTEQGGPQMIIPTTQMTFRPHHRHSTSLSSMRTTGGESVGLTSASLQAVPQRMTVLNTPSVQKDQLMDMTSFHEPFVGGGVGLDILSDFTGSFGDISPSGVGNSSGLLAALDLPMTGCGMTGIALSSLQLTRHVLASVPDYVEVYWQKFHQLYPIVHRATFESAAEDVLRYAMAAVASQYLDTKEDRLRGSQLHEYAWQELRRIPQWNLHVMQAILLCELFARFRGRRAVTRPSKMFESLYSRVLYHNPGLFDAALPGTDNTAELDTRWQAWLDAEARRRLLTACFIVDVHTSAYQQQKHAQQYDPSTGLFSTAIPLSATSQTLWEARTAASWATFLAADPESGIPTFAQTCPNATAYDLASLPPFDTAAILALALIQLPRLLHSTTQSSLHPDSGTSTLKPLVRPRSTPGYSTITSPVDPTPNLVVPISTPLASAITNPALSLGTQSSHPSPSHQLTETRLSSLFADCARANTYLALRHTPLHDLLAVSGDSWIFSQKVLPATSFLEHQRRLKLWIEAGTGNDGGRKHAAREAESVAGGFGLSAAQATIYAARAIMAFLERQGGDEDEEGREPDSAGSLRSSAASWMVDLSDYWALYVCALICWAFGHRVRVEKGPDRAKDSESGVEGGQEAAGDAVRKPESDENAIGWLKMVSNMESEKAVKVRGRPEAGGVVGLVRRKLEWDCVGGRSRLYVDAVGVLKKLEEGVNRKWF